MFCQPQTAVIDTKAFWTGHSRSGGKEWGGGTSSSGGSVTAVTRAGSPTEESCDTRVLSQSEREDFVLFHFHF